MMTSGCWFARCLQVSAVKGLDLSTVHSRREANAALEPLIAVSTVTLCLPLAMLARVGPPVVCRYLCGEAHAVMPWFVCVCVRARACGWECGQDPMIRAFVLQNLVVSDSGVCTWRINMPVIAEWGSRLSQFERKFVVHFGIHLLAAAAAAVLAFWCGCVAVVVDQPLPLESLSFAVRGCAWIVVVALLHCCKLAPTLS